MAELGELIYRSGLTYRQVDYYCRQGWIRERFRTRGKSVIEMDHGGRGLVRYFTPEEERVLVHMGRLVNAGLEPEVAARVARDTPDADGTISYWLASGLLLKIYGEAL